MFKNLNLPDFLIRNRGWITYGIMAVALIGFEMFNYSTTQYALNDLLGDLKFVGFQWATILAIAFCGIDFAGLARLFIPEEAGTNRETWYLFGAWMLAAIMNAILTWWGVAMALQGHSIQSASILDKKLVAQVVPVFVAIMVWITRILLIGSFSMAGRKVAAAGYRPTVRRAPAVARPAAQPQAQIPSVTATAERQPLRRPAQAPAQISAGMPAERPAPARRAVAQAGPGAAQVPVPGPRPQPLIPTAAAPNPAPVSAQASVQRPQPLIPTATAPAVQKAAAPVRPEPEYVSEHTPPPNPLPALRPALSASPRPGAARK